jgi:hypothetical protein
MTPFLRQQIVEPLMNPLDVIVLHVLIHRVAYSESNRAMRRMRRGDEFARVAPETA